MLFADVAGSMDLQERLDAEVWAQIMGRFVAILAEGVRKFGGTVDKFTGDGIMALFGAPVAQEDHARRACHAAWELTKTIGEYSDELRWEQGVELHVRLGLNSGEVVVGRVGDDVTLDPTALGHTVGLAQRMEALAQPGRAYLTEGTARLVEGWFVLDDLGPVAVRGAREPLRVYAVAGPAAVAPVVHGAALRGARLVGRDREIGVLEDALTVADDGHFQVVGVVGEAGVGKSRICDDFARSLVARDVTVRRTGGVSHGRDVPLLPILAFYRDYFGITEADEPAKGRHKVRGQLLELDPALEPHLPVIFDFLGVPDPERPAAPMTPEVRMRRIFDVVRRATARRSERQVLVLVFEDLHWFDPQSLVFLERLIETYPGSRTMIVTNFRPEFSAQWMRHSYYRQVSLSPLHDRAVADLLASVLGTDPSLMPLVRFISERTGGNPFFVEELLRALIGDGTLVGEEGAYRLVRPLGDITVPPSVQALLGARIDRLAPSQKLVLQTAAVVGRTFSEPVLSGVLGEDGHVDETLGALCASELLQQTTVSPWTTYRFWHALTQEVAYGTLLNERRRRLHGSVAEALINHQRDNLDEQAAVIAWHWERAGQPLEAARWNLRAGNWAIRSDLAEAVRRWQATLELLDPLAQTPDTLDLAVQTRMRLLRFGARHGMAPDRLQELEVTGRASAGQLGHPGLAAMMAMACGSARQFTGDLKTGCKLYHEAIRLTDGTGDPALRAAILAAACGAFPFAGPLEEGLAFTAEVLHLAADDPNVGEALVGYRPRTLALTLRGWFLCRTGRLEEAVATVEEAVTSARSTSALEALAFALSLVPWLAWLRGDGTDTLAEANEAVRIGEETGNNVMRIFGLQATTIALLVAGHPTEALANATMTLRESRERRAGLNVECEMASMLAHARLATGDREGAAAVAEEAVQIARRQGAEVGECLAVLTRAQAGLAATPVPDHARGDLETAVGLIRQTGARVYEPFALEPLARIRQDREQLQQALRLYRQIGATGHAHRLEMELSERAVP